ncbi:MAG: aminomethyl-transferring glycine dehydrogenase subunit GcvPB [Bacteroidales bacterium]|nr:aminomethyl-transferring glycine dehydrogenase subunit GcvPB [Bacteroidales bacterium]
MKYYDKLIFELSREGRTGYSLGSSSFAVDGVVPEAGIPSGLRRGDAPALPQVSEIDVVRHYTNLSQMNFGVDTGFYPLGSCTMKYNPKINEEIANMKGFQGLHPLQPASTVQGALEVYSGMNKALSALTGMAGFTFNPCAGAHGELTGLMVMRRYHALRGDLKRTKVIVPDSAHGTNPASAAVCGLEVVVVKSKADGLVDVNDLKPLLGDDIAGIMMTNPNTLGLFEKDIRQIADLIHGCGGLLYYDGANMNPLIGVARPGDMGFDILHLNLHKSFSTPHGGGGPGSGPVGVCEKLLPCLPVPKVERNGKGELVIVRDAEQTAGEVSGFLGNFGVILRGYAYILMLGKQNVKMVGRYATLAANYIKESLKDCYKLPIQSVCKHEFVYDGLIDDGSRKAADGTVEREGATTLDVAKRLLDFGFHAPTIYFPLLFHQAIMIEPTETESVETLDAFIEVMRKIAAEAAEDPAILKAAPHNAPITRPDETTAARQPVLKYQDETV